MISSLILTYGPNLLFKYPALFDSRIIFTLNFPVLFDILGISHFTLHIIYDSLRSQLISCFRSWPIRKDFRILGTCHCNLAKKSPIFQGKKLVKGCILMQLRKRFYFKSLKAILWYSQLATLSRSGQAMASSKTFFISLHPNHTSLTSLVSIRFCSRLFVMYRPYRPSLKK